MLFETFLCLGFPPPRISFITYADRYKDLGKIAARCGNLLLDWGWQYGMTFSPSKMVAVLLKGKLVWNHIVELGGLGSHSGTRSSTSG